jgi:pycsar effector protein
MQNVAESRPHEITDALYFAWQSDGYITDFIRLADTKAGAILAVMVGVVGFSIERVIAQGSMSVWQWLMVSVALAADLIAILAAFLVVAPRRSIPREGLPVVQDVGALVRRQAPNPNGTLGLIHWDHVAARTPAEYKASLVSFSPEELLEQVVAHCNGSAHVAVRKYALLRIAFSFGVPGLLLSAGWVLTL